MRDLLQSIEVPPSAPTHIGKSVKEKELMDEAFRSVHIKPEIDLKAIIGVLNGRQEGGGFDEKTIDELSDEELRYALVQMNGMAIQRDVWLALSKNVPNFDFNSPETQRLFGLLTEMVGAAYDVSSIINRATLNTDTLQENEKMVLNGATKTLAELVEMADYDTDESLSFKCIFAQLLFHSFNIHKLRNDRLNAASNKSSADRYLNIEHGIVKHIQNYFDVWMRGALDMELASRLALSRIDGISEATSSTSGEDVRGGTDLWIKIDPTPFMEKIPTKVRKSPAFERFFAQRMGIQVKSHQDGDGIGPGEIRFDVREGGRNGERYDVSEERGKEMPYFKVTMDVCFDGGLQKRRKIRLGNSEVVLSQFDFDKVPRRGVQSGTVDKIPEILLNMFASHF
ncbi:MAG: hypothetical protein HGA31_00785 [Candidatus Moranbacteria bacterium]|nr:hypothetical protein [Candidatus Moranbacteria bacterium]